MNKDFRRLTEIAKISQPLFVCQLGITIGINETDLHILPKQAELAGTFENNPNPGIFQRINAYSARLVHFATSMSGKHTFRFWMH